MKNVIEFIGETLSELVGTAATVIGLSGAIVLFGQFADDFINFFI